MERCRLLAFQRHLTGADSVHEMAVIDTAGKETQCQRGAAEDGMAGHQHDIHLSVLYAGSRCYQSFVAPLVGVGEGDKERLVRHVQSVAHQMIGLRRVAERIVQDILQIGHEPAPGAACEMVCHQCVKTRAAGADKQPVVRHAVIDTDGLGVVQHLYRFDGLDRDVQMTCKTVPAAHRENTQSRLRVFQTARHFIHRSVAAHCHHGVKPHTCILTGKLRGMTRIFREGDVGKPLFSVECLHDEFRQFFLGVLSLL